MLLEDLEVYKISLEISGLAWLFYNELPKTHRFTQGNQLLEAADSIGANLAEGYGRYHYRDSLKFYYNSRGSLLELKHWNTLLIKRNLIQQDKLKQMSLLIEKEHLKLNAFINTFKNRNLFE